MDPRVPLRPGAPWWWVRLRHMSPREHLWRAARLARPAPPTPCPPGATPRWPWPLPVADGPPHPVPTEALAPIPRWRPGAAAVDPKPAWARHQLHDLVRARLAGRRVDLDPWWQAHREAAGTWASSHPVAQRIPALALLGHREALWAHADHLHRHPSRFSSAGNHRVAELAALALARRCLPDLPGAEPVGPALTALLHPDGWPREQSIAYLAHVLEWGLVAHRCGEPLHAPLRAGATTLEACLSDDGHPFAIGDDGSDLVLPGDEDAPSYAWDVAGCIRAALGEPALHWRPGRRALLLGLGPTTAAPSPGPRSFAAGGFTVLRSPRLVVGVDHGPLGLAPLCAHGHDDLLALWAHRDGRPWLVGRGTSAYHDPDVRWVERGPWGSCGLLLDDRARAAAHPHPFLWRRTAHAQLDRLQMHPVGGTVAAHHDAWQGIRHTRTVRVEGAELVVEDQLDGEGVHHVAIRWHLAPGLEERVDGDAEYRLDSPLPVSTCDTRHALGYGHTTTASTLCAEGVVRLPARLVSRWSPRD